METDNSDKDFLKDAPTLAAISKENPLAIPTNYFESLNNSLNTRIKIETMRFKQEDEFQIPAKYFDTLSDRIENRIQTETIQMLIPSDGFQVPDGYFAELTHQINSKTNESKAIGRKKNIFTSWLSYSAAASIAMVIGVFFYFNSTVYSINKKLADVPDQEIINYLQAHSTIADTPYIIENLGEESLQDVSTDVSSEDLEQYINNTTL